MPLQHEGCVGRLRVILPAQWPQTLTPGPLPCPPHHVWTLPQQPRAAAPGTRAACTTPGTAQIASSEDTTAVRTSLLDIVSSPDRSFNGHMSGTMHASLGTGVPEAGGESFQRTAGRAADRAWSREALAPCGMPREPPTHASTSSCSGKPCAAQALATEAIARTAAADSASAPPSAAGCRTACKGWQHRLQMRT